MSTHHTFSSIKQALDAIRMGEFVVVLDNEDRENEGDLIMAAEFATEASLAFMIRHSSGLICVPALEHRLKELELPLMVANNSESRQCKFTVSVDLIAGNTTGISAADRARTIAAIANNRMSARDFSRPGHIFPLLAVSGGVIARAGHTEAATDLTRLAGCTPVGYICEITNDNGKMMRQSELVCFAREHNLHIITISDLIRFRFDCETLVILNEPQRAVNTPMGSFRHYVFKSLADTGTFDVLWHGIGEENVIVHIAQSGIDGNVQSQWAQQRIQSEECGGAIIYYTNKIELHEICGKDMADQIVFGTSAQILKKLGIRSMRLLSAVDVNFKLSGFGMPVNEVIKFL